MSSSDVAEGSNLYYQDVRARAALSAPAAPITYNNATGAIGITQSTNGAHGYLSSSDWSAFNAKQTALTAATGSSNGYLASTDWIIFNAKEPAISAGTTSQYWRGDKSWQSLITTAVSEGTNLYYSDARARLALSASAPLSYSNSTGVFSLAKAMGSVDGYLSSGDWTTFNTGSSQWTTSSSNIYRASGNVGIGTTAPGATLDITGTATASGGFGTLIQSSQPASNYVPSANGGWLYTGESLITVPSGSSRRYRVVMRQMMFSGANCAVTFFMSTYTGSPTGNSPGAGVTVTADAYATANAETFLTLAPGTYTYYILVGYFAGALSSPLVFNGSSNNRIDSDFFALQM